MSMSGPLPQQYYNNSSPQRTNIQDERLNWSPVNTPHPSRLPSVVDVSPFDREQYIRSREQEARAVEEQAQQYADTRLLQSSYNNNNNNNRLSSSSPPPIPQQQPPPVLKYSSYASPARPTISSSTYHHQNQSPPQQLRTSTSSPPPFQNNNSNNNNNHHQESPPPPQQQQYRTSPQLWASPTRTAPLYLSPPGTTTRSPQQQQQMQYVTSSAPAPRRAGDPFLVQSAADAAAMGYVGPQVPTPLTYRGGVGLRHTAASIRAASEDGMVPEDLQHLAPPGDVPPPPPPLPPPHMLAPTLSSSQQRQNQLYGPPVTFSSGGARRGGGQQQFASITGPVPTATLLAASRSNNMVASPIRTATTAEFAPNTFRDHPSKMFASKAEKAAGVVVAGGEYISPDDYDHVPPPPPPLPTGPTATRVVRMDDDMNEYVSKKQQRRQVDGDVVDRDDFNFSPPPLSSLRRHDSKIRLEHIKTNDPISSPPPPPGEEYDRYGFALASNGLVEDEYQHESWATRADRENARQIKWLEMLQDWPTWIARRTKKIRQRTQKGIPESVRGEAWQMLADSKVHALRYVGVFDQLVQSPCDAEAESTIVKDLHRTFPKHAHFRAGGFQDDGRVTVNQSQLSLYRMLHAYAVHDPEIGYCQGMAFIAALFLLYMTEEEAFWLLTRVVSGYNMRGLFLPAMPFFGQYCYQFSRLFEAAMPKLYAHFCELEIVPQMFASQWFLTVYASAVPSQLPFELVVRIWDEFIAGRGKWKIVFQVGLAIIHRNRKDLMFYNFEDILSYLRNPPPAVVEPVDDFLKLARRMPVTSRRLAELAEDYAEEVALQNYGGSPLGPVLAKSARQKVAS